MSSASASSEGHSSQTARGVRSFIPPSLGPYVLKVKANVSYDDIDPIGENTAWLLTGEGKGPAVEPMPPKAQKRASRNGKQRAA